MTVPEQDHRARVTTSEVSDLVWIWEDWYTIGHDGGAFIAVSKVDGREVQAITAIAFKAALRDDFAEHYHPLGG